MFFKTFSPLLVLLLLILSESVFAWKMEADKIVVNNTSGGVITHINFRQSYNSPPLVFTLATNNGSDPSALRVINVSTTGFDIYSVEPDGSDGTHAQMSAVPYIAIEAGSHELPNGTRVVAGIVNTQRFQSKTLVGSSWQSVGLSGFSSTPVVLGQIQTRVNERTDATVPTAVPQPWMTASIDNISSSGFNLALERAETTTGTLTSNESIAYLAIDSGLNGGSHYFASSTAGKIEYESIRSNQIIQGWDNNPANGYTINFSKTYSNPIAVSTINTRNDADGGWLRRRSISGNSMALLVDEDKAVDAERSHTTERAGLFLFSKPFDVEFNYNGQAEMVINEVMYNESVTGVNNDEFVELFVTTSGNLKGTIISDQDTHFYTFPSHMVLAGEFVIYHTGTGTNSSAAGIHHFYHGVSNIWNNANDDILLLKPAKDVTVSTDGKIFNAIPYDYMAYGRSSIGGSVDAIPTSVQGVTTSWNYAFGNELKNAVDGESIALTPNTVDSNKAGCWERTSSGNASNNSCAGYLVTKDTHPSFINSLGMSNTATPEITLTKTVLTIYDPYNGASNPKAIPGAILEYSISAKNDGSLAADHNSINISDLIPTNTKLCVSNSGHCTPPYFVNGSPSSGMSLAGTVYSNNNGATFAYTASGDAEGADANVTNLRASMSGAFQEKTGASAPNFSLKFRVLVK